MGLLQPINGNERQTLREIINSKTGRRKTRLLRMTARILRRYNTYERHASDLAALPASRFEGTDRADCEHCYDQETVPLARLKSAVVAVLPLQNSLLCPLCGLNSWETFDHLTPKSGFPEFSVLPRNLVPCCWRCNQLKGDTWHLGRPSLVLNVYYDRWPRKRFLEASIDFDPDAGALVKFSLIQKRYGRTSRKRLQQHFQQLNLAIRFAAAGASAVDRYRRSLKHQAYSTREQRKKYLRREALALAEKHGPNHWESVILDALADCDKFLNSI